MLPPNVLDLSFYRRLYYENFLKSIATLFGEASCANFLTHNDYYHWSFVEGVVR